LTARKFTLGILTSLTLPIKRISPPRENCIHHARYKNGHRNRSKIVCP
jgi:hypothetical protein